MFSVQDGPVLICYDGSDESRHAIKVAAALLAEKRAVVLSLGPLDLVAETYAAAGSGGADAATMLKAEAVAQAEAGATAARAAGFRAEARGELEAVTWRGIVEIAQELDAPVIVVGSRGLSRLREIVEESVSHQVAEHAGRPVLIVPAARDPR
jgi:nucleotide-binding universal stress UspA family protein